MPTSSEHPERHVFACTGCGATTWTNQSSSCLPESAEEDRVRAAGWHQFADWPLVPDLDNPPGRTIVLCPKCWPL